MIEIRFKCYGCEKTVWFPPAEMIDVGGERFACSEECAEKVRGLPTPVPKPKLTRHQFRGQGLTNHKQTGN